MSERLRFAVAVVVQVPLVLAFAKLEAIGGFWVGWWAGIGTAIWIQLAVLWIMLGTDLLKGNATRLNIPSEPRGSHRDPPAD